MNGGSKTDFEGNPFNISIPGSEPRVTVLNMVGKPLCFPSWYLPTDRSYFPIRLLWNADACYNEQRILFYSCMVNNVNLAS